MISKVGLGFKEEHTLFYSDKHTHLSLPNIALLRDGSTATVQNMISKIGLRLKDEHHHFHAVILSYGKERHPKDRVKLQRGTHPCSAVTTYSVQDLTSKLQM